MSLLTAHWNDVMCACVCSDDLVFLCLNYVKKLPCKVCKHTNVLFIRSECSSQVSSLFFYLIYSVLDLIDLSKCFM